MSREDFQASWRDQHAPPVASHAKTLRIPRYPRRTSSDEGRQAAFELLEDEHRFIDLENSPLWIGEELEVVGPTAAA
jgi:EthD domain